MTATGTVYSLADPRDGKVRYIGQTKQPPEVRARGRYAPRVLAWMAELRDAGLAPSVAAVREDVPAGDLLAAEREEITRILVAGGTLLNEQATADARKVLRERREADRIAAEQAAWRELADVALDTLGGPLPPGNLPEIKISDAAWHFMSRIGPDFRKGMNSFLNTSEYPSVDQLETLDERHQFYRALRGELEDASRELQRDAYGAWGKVCWMGDDRFRERLYLNVSIVAETPCASRADASRFLSLIVWYMVAVLPWQHLAELGELAADDESFTTWAGQDIEVREAFNFLAARREGLMMKLPHTWYSPYEKGPGHLLGVTAAAYSGTVPQPEGTRRDFVVVLSELAKDHELTQPMADLLLRLQPRALDSIFGKDVADEIDHSLSLPAGTAGRVLRALGECIGQINDGAVSRAIDRSAQALPVTALPDYRDWSGPSAIAARVISASLVRAGLAEPDCMTSAEYLADVSALWTPDLERLKRLAA